MQAASKQIPYDDFLYSLFHRIKELATPNYISETKKLGMNTAQFELELLPLLISCRDMMIVYLTAAKHTK